MTKANFTNVWNEYNLQWKTTSNRRLHQISKVKYLSNYWSDLLPILKLGLCDQIKLYKCFKWRQPPIEDDLKWKTTWNGRLPQISKVKYLTNNWSDLPKILYLGLYDQSKVYKCLKWRRPIMKEDLKWKTTSSIKIKISQQLLVCSSPNFKLRLMWPKQTLEMFKINTTSNGRRPQMKDYLKSESQKYNTFQLPWYKTFQIKRVIYD